MNNKFKSFVALAKMQKPRFHPCHVNIFFKEHVVGHARLISRWG
jgi:hypothetical protein